MIVFFNVFNCLFKFVRFVGVITCILRASACTFFLFLNVLGNFLCVIFVRCVLLNFCLVLM